MESEALLTKEQKEFLEECTLEFSERFTEADMEFKKVLEAGISSPPIMSPWYGKPRFNNRDRAGGSRYDNNYRHRNRNFQENNHRDRRQHQNEQHFRPY